MKGQYLRYAVCFFTAMIIATIIILLSILFRPRPNVKTLQSKAHAIREYALAHQLNQRMCILVDYSIPSGANRLFVWNLQKDALLYSCLVAHGGGLNRNKFAPIAFSNENGSHLSSLGRCKISERYIGRYGISYRLDGLDSSNSNVRARNIVLHAHKALPSFQIFPFRIIHSQGCIMISKKSMRYLDEILRNEKDIILYTYHRS